jgi:uncharacterized protein YcaQ
VHELTQEQARRIAVRAQLLALPRPGSTHEVIAHLGHLQDDPTDVVAPSAELVLWTRLGPSFDVAELDEARGSGRLVELRGHLRPAADIALYRAEMQAWPFAGPHKEWQDSHLGWLTANEETRQEVLDRLHEDGPLPSTEFPDTTAVPWESSGWNNDRSVRMLLQLMESRGDIATAGHDDGARLWDLAERVHPDVAVVPLEEAYAERGRRRLRALGIDRRRETTMNGLQLREDTSGEPATVEGAPGRWRVDPAYLADLDDFEGRAAILSPLDRLVFDRDRMERLFGFDYQLEMYKPAAKRRWGYWAMPVLHGDRLVGKVDATADRDAGLLRVDAVHEDGRWTRGMRAEVDEEVDALGSWLGLAR